MPLRGYSLIGGKIIIAKHSKKLAAAGIANCRQPFVFFEQSLNGIWDDPSLRSLAGLGVQMNP